MEVRAVAKYVKVQPRKVRIIADEIRGRNAEYSVSLLQYHPSKSARLLRKVLLSAMANAQENHNLPPEALRIATIMIDEGPRQKRMQARAMGRGNIILKKTSHITVVVEDFEEKGAVKAHGTKAKARPTFGGKKDKKKAPKEAAPVAAAPVEEVEAPVEEVAAPVEEVTDTTAEEVSAAPAGEGEGITATAEDATEEVQEATPVTEAEAPEEEGGEGTIEGETTAQAEGAEEEEKGA